VIRLSYRPNGRFTLKGPTEDGGLGIDSKAAD
jgi:hypothetical protein